MALLGLPRLASSNRRTRHVPNACPPAAASTRPCQDQPGSTVLRGHACTVMAYPIGLITVDSFGFRSRTWAVHRSGIRADSSIQCHEGSRQIEYFQTAFFQPTGHGYRVDKFRNSCIVTRGSGTHTRVDPRWGWAMRCGCLSTGGGVNGWDFSKRTPGYCYRYSS
jgi:hypothetical protein